MSNLEVAYVLFQQTMSIALLIHCLTTLKSLKNEKTLFPGNRCSDNSYRL